MTPRFALPLAAFLMTVPASAQSAPAGDTVEVRPGNPLPLPQNLRVGTRDYLRYLKFPDGKVTLAALERSTVAFVGTGEAARVHIAHEGSGPDMSYGFKSVFLPVTLRPVEHARWRDWKGDKVEETFAFTPTRATGTYKTPEGMKELDLATPTGFYNFEVDIETLPTLPWAAGRTIVIPFYHPGSGEPADYRFEVTGETNVMVGAKAIPAWTVTTDYNAPGRGDATFWIAKDGGTVLRVEQKLPNGNIFVKALILS